MNLIHTIKEIKQALNKHKFSGKTIGLVPTMGALHQGHLALIKESKLNSDITVVSVFVNPAQFNNKRDLEKYPRNLKKDILLLEKEEVDYVFAPSVEEMYPESVRLQFHFFELEEILEGKFRPLHFNGVAVVVSKLFHLIQPARAYFGQKDLQQAAIIKRMVKDLNFDLDVKVIPTIREADGLALSSRNERLNPQERKKAILLYKSLLWGKVELLRGISWFQVRDKIMSQFEEMPGVKLEYYELVKEEPFELVSTLEPDQSYAICIAAYIGEVRLIDNLSVSI